MAPSLVQIKSIPKIPVEDQGHLCSGFRPDPLPGACVEEMSLLLTKVRSKLTGRCWQVTSKQGLWSPLISFGPQRRVSYISTPFLCYSDLELWQMVSRIYFWFFFPRIIPADLKPSIRLWAFLKPRDSIIELTFPCVECPWSWHMYIRCSSQIVFYGGEYRGG